MLPFLNKMFKFNKHKLKYKIIKLKIQFQIKASKIIHLNSKLFLKMLPMSIN
jgi:hypothetical protein